MTTKIIYLTASKGFILFSAFSLGYVALLAIINPQSVMDLVGVKLPNTDAISSIRGIYGGVGITLVLLLLYLAFFQTIKGLSFLSLFWGSYALSRIITWFSEGALGEFGTNWLVIESIMCLIGILLLIFSKKIKGNL
ncbi:MAG: DUF4345 domain-containing protein [Cyclobacteriaceae bacterium]|jgi:hypothetical protein|nr:DUF4345 domain-containing protein [Cyclobacteriaceae bacterium]MCU0397541.1 DUF4345 domain-containing protein [Cyclobacteriaceae bacterium]